MVIDKMSFEEFIRKFDNYFPNFILRVRDPEKNYNNDDKECIAYYNGIKAFIVKENKKGIKLDFPINVYKLNPTGLKNASKKSNEEEILIDEQVEDLEEGKTREQKEKEYRIKTGDIFNAMSNLFYFEMDKITFDIDFTEKKDKKNIKDEIIKKFYKLIVKEFAELTNSHNRNKDTKNLESKSDFQITNNKNDDIMFSNLSEKKFKDICDKFSDKIRFTLNFTPKLTTEDKQRNSTPKDIIILQCWFLRKARDIGSASGIDFNVKSYYKNKNYDTETALKKFSKATTNAIENYKSTSCEKLEKSYQHFFMLRAHEMIDLFDIKKGEYVDYFEQEYGIYNPKVYGSEKFKSDEKTDKTGRIDCIVYKYKLNGNERLITDIYMVELKVNCDVILGDNGVMTHLEDINAFLNFSSTDKYQYYDYDTLEKRICDRIEILSGNEINANFAKNVSKHFYTVIGYTEKSEIDIIKGMLKGLNVNADELIKIGYPKTVNGKTKKFKLNERFEGTTLRELKQNIKNCDIKFFLETNTFDEKNIGLDFDDITKELF